MHLWRQQGGYTAGEQQQLSFPGGGRGAGCHKNRIKFRIFGTLGSSDAKISLQGRVIVVIRPAWEPLGVPLQSFLVEEVGVISSASLSS